VRVGADQVTEERGEDWSIESDRSEEPTALRQRQVPFTNKIVLITAEDDLIEEQL
jgi:hypothetical protein